MSLVENSVGFTTIRISFSVWKKINSLKRVGETFSDVLERIKLVESN